MNNKTILTAEEVSELLGIHRETVYLYAKNGKLPAFKLGYNWRFRQQSLISWIQQKEGNDEKSKISPISLNKTSFMNKRETPRYEINLPIEIKIKDTNKIIQGEIMDISKKGICISSEKKISTTNNLIAEMPLPENNTTLKADINMVWHKDTDVNNNKFKYGIQFSKLTKKQTSILNDFIHGFINISRGKNITFKAAKTSGDFDEIYELRRKVFVEEDGYPLQAIKTTLKFQERSTCFLAYRNRKPVGTITVTLDSFHGLPIEKFAPLNKFRNKKIAEISKFAVLPEERRKNKISLALMLLAYKFVKKNNVGNICIFSLKQKRENIRLYKKMNFKIIRETSFYKKEAVIMLLDIEKNPVYENQRKNPTRSKLAKTLSKTIGNYN